MRNELIKSDSITEEQLSPLLRRKINGTSNRVTKVVESLTNGSTGTGASSKGVAVHAVATYPVVPNGTVEIDGIDSEEGRKYLLTAQQPASGNGIWICKGAAWERSSDTMFGGVLISAQNDKSIWMLTDPNTVVSGDAMQFVRVLPETPCVSIELVRAMLTKALCDTDINATVYQAEMCPSSWLVIQNSDEVINWQSVTVSSKYIRNDNGTLTPMLAGWYRVSVKFYDEATNGASLQQLKIKGNGNLNSLIDRSERDRYTGTAVNLWGERLVYCNGIDDTIQICLRHNNAGANTYRTLIGSFHNSYCIVTYQGIGDAGNLGD